MNFKKYLQFKVIVTLEKTLLYLIHSILAVLFSQLIIDYHKSESAITEYLGLIIVGCILLLGILFEVLRFSVHTILIGCVAGFMFGIVPYTALILIFPKLSAENNFKKKYVATAIGYITDDLDNNGEYYQGLSNEPMMIFNIADSISYNRVTIDESDEKIKIKKFFYYWETAAFKGYDPKNFINYYNLNNWQKFEFKVKMISVYCVETIIEQKLFLLVIFLTFILLSNTNIVVAKFKDLRHDSLFYKKS
jgi:hypothetical protein